MNNMMKSITYYLLGSSLIAVGIVINVYSKIGLGPFDAASANLSKLIDLSIGMSMNIILLILLLTQLIIKPSWTYFFGTLFSFIIGIMVDVFMPLISEPTLFAVKLLYFIGSLALFPVGVSLMISSKIAVGPIENLPLLIHKITGLRYFISKMSFEIIYVILALIFGYLSNIGIGYVQIGTLIIMIYIGPAIQFCIKFIPIIKKSA